MNIDQIIYKINCFLKETCYQIDEKKYSYDDISIDWTQLSEYANPIKGFYSLSFAKFIKCLLDMLSFFLNITRSKFYLILVEATLIISS
jgi:hypothetical protein